MDNEPKTFKIQFKGTAYTFAEIPADDYTTLTVVLNMHASPLKAASSLFKVLSASAGADQWDKITDRFVAREVVVEDFVKLFETILKKQIAAAKADQVDAE